VLGEASRPPISCASERLRFSGESTAFGIGEANALSAQALLENFMRARTIPQICANYP